MPNEINSEAVCVWPADAQLGEGPTWVASEGAIYWLDIKKGAIHRLHLETGERRWPRRATVSASWNSIPTRSTASLSPNETDRGTA